MEHGALGPDHVQQDAIAGAVSGHVGLAGPILGAETPVRVVLVPVGQPFRLPIVLGIEEGDVNAHIRQAVSEQPGEFEQDPNPGSAVVGPIDGLVRPDRILVGEGAGVPMCIEHHPAAHLRPEGPEDVADVEGGPVIGRDPPGLDRHVRSVALEGGGEPVGAGPVPLRVGHSRPEGHLLGHVGIGTVPGKGRSLDEGPRSGRRWGRRRALGFGLTATGEENEPQSCGEESPKGAFNQTSNSFHPFHP